MYASAVKNIAVRFNKRSTRTHTDIILGWIMTQYSPVKSIMIGQECDVLCRFSWLFFSLNHERFIHFVFSFQMFKCRNKESLCVFFGLSQKLSVTFILQSKKGISFSNESLWFLRRRVMACTQKWFWTCGRNFYSWQQQQRGLLQRGQLISGVRQG